MYMYIGDATSHYRGRTEPSGLVIFRQCVCFRAIVCQKNVLLFCLDRTHRASNAQTISAQLAPLALSYVHFEAMYKYFAAPLARQLPRFLDTPAQLVGNKLLPHATTTLTPHVWVVLAAGDSSRIRWLRRGLPWLGLHEPKDRGKQSIFQVAPTT